VSMLRPTMDGAKMPSAPVSDMCIPGLHGADSTIRIRELTSHRGKARPEGSVLIEGDFQAVGRLESALWAVVALHVRRAFWCFLG